VAIGDIAVGVKITPEDTKTLVRRWD